MLSQTTPLVQAADAELTASVEENLFALFRAMAMLPGSQLAEAEQLSYHITSPTSPIFSGMWRTRLTSENADAAIDQTLALFKAQGAVRAAWWVTSTTQPPDFGDRLLAHGLTASYLDAPGMALDLQTASAALSTPDSFTIVRASTQQHLDDWRDVFLATYHTPAFAAQSWIDATLSFGIDAAPWQLYVGYLGDQPVATNLLFKGGGVAGLFAVGTIPEAQRKGIGAAITLKPLLDARAQGYRYGVLFASEMGYPVYRRIGFRDVPIQIGRYFWQNT